MKNFNLEKFKDYVNTYENQTGHENYSKETVIDDFIYGIGICLDEEKYKNADGYAKFKDRILEYFIAKRRTNTDNKLTHGERSIIFEILYPGAWADIFIHNSFPKEETHETMMDYYNIPRIKNMSIEQTAEKNLIKWLDENHMLSHDNWIEMLVQYENDK